MSIAPSYAALSRLQHLSGLPAQASPVHTPISQAAPSNSSYETALLNAYIEAVQRKVQTGNAGLITVPAQSALGQWLELYRAQVEHPVVQSWLHAQQFGVFTTLSVDPFKGTLSVEEDGRTRTFTLSDTSGWGQISGPLLAAAKVIAPENRGALRVKLTDDSTQVSVEVVANFQGIPLPETPSQANEQIRHLRVQNAFDLIPSDDHVRPASRRSPHALAVQRQDAARFYIGAPQALEYKRLAVNVATQLPNTREEAKKWAEKLIVQLTGTHVDADTIFLNRFKTASTPLSEGTATVTGWEHPGEEPYSSLRLPDALLKNFNEHDGVPGNLDLDAGLYLDGPGQSTKGGYGAHNQFPLAPSALMHASWKTDFQAEMTQKIDRFWSTQSENYEIAIKGEFIYQARKQLTANEARPPAERALQAPEHKFTREDYRLVMGAASNLPLDEHAPLTIEQLKASSPDKGTTQVHALSLHGFTSSDMVRFSAADGRQVLSMPGAEPVFLRFDSLEKLNQWVVDQTKDPKKREDLLSHFPLIYRQDHEAGFVARAAKALMPILWFTHVGEKTEGLSTLFEKMSTGKLKGPAIDDSHSKIEGDVFHTVTTSTKERMKSDADTVIKSNSEVIRDTWLNDITVAAGLLAKLAPIAVPVAVAAVVTGLTEFTLGAEKASSGDTEAERKDGASKAFDGVLNTLFSVGASAAPEDPFALSPEKEITPGEQVLPPEVEVQEEPQPGPSSGERAVSNTVQQPAARSQSLIPLAQYAVAEGETLIKNIAPDAKGVYRVVDNNGVLHQYVRLTDETGTSKVFEISGRYRTGNSFAKIINPKNGAGLIVITPGRNGEWARAPANGGGWWKRASSPTPSLAPKALPKLSDQFLEVDGTKMKGAEKLDKYFNLDNNEYIYGIALDDDGEIRPLIAWVSEENPANATPPPADYTSEFGTNEYSETFIKDLNRSKFTITTPGGKALEIDVGKQIKELQLKKGALLTTEEVNELKQKNLQEFEQLIPDPELRKKISGVSNQWALAAIPDEFRTSRLKGPAFASGRDPHYYINYDPASDATTITAKSDVVIKTLDETHTGLEDVSDLEVKVSRTLTLRLSKEVDNNGYVLAPSSPIRIEVKPAQS